MAVIYCIENKINNKKYIGRTIRNPKERIRFHKNHLSKNSHVNNYLQRAWNKYGEENFYFYIVEECTEENINQREIYWIKKLDTQNREKGYNITKGGKGTSGWKASEETKEKHRKLMLNMSEETRNKLRKKAKGNKNANGVKFTQERKNKISKALLYKKKKNSSSKFHGVSFLKNRNKWTAHISVNKKLIFLGNFEDEVDAAKAYNNYVKNNNLPNPLNNI